MRVLVIGGTGLISTAIVARLLTEGHEPILFNRGTTATRFDGDVDVIHGDRNDVSAFEGAVKDLAVDGVIDMLTYDAARATENVALFRDRVAHYVFAAPCASMGGPLSKIPAVESESRTPVSPYGRGKLAAENVFFQAHADFGFPVTQFRPSHCYGPGMPLLDIWGYDASLVSRLRAGKPILVAGDGHGLWQPGHVADMAKGFVGALGREVTFGKAYNIVGDEVMTWRDFHGRMASALGLEAHLVALTTEQIVAGTPDGKAEWLRENFQYHAAYDGAALKADVPAYRDLASWEEGVRDTVAWMDEAGVHEGPDAKPWVDKLIQAAAAFTMQLEGLR